MTNSATCLSTMTIADAQMILDRLEGIHDVVFITGGSGRGFKRSPQRLPRWRRKVQA